MRRLSIILLVLSCILAQPATQPPATPPDSKTGPPAAKDGATQTKDSQAEPKSAAPDANDTKLTSGRIIGHVYDISGKPLGDVRITLLTRDPETHRETRSSSDKGKEGSYDTGDLPAGTYDLNFEKIGFGSEVIRSVKLTTASQIVDATLCKGCIGGKPCGLASDGWVSWLLVGVFVVSICAWRWHNIMAPNRSLLLSRAADVRKRADAAGISDERIKDIEARFKSGPKAADFFFWSRGEENAAFSTLHFIELDLLEKLPEDRVNARLATARSFLSQSDEGVAKDFVKRIDNAMDASAANTPVSRKELLFEVQYYQYGASDTDYATMTSWQNKALWLTVIGLSLIAMLSVAADRNVLFVAGAAGGFLSRLMQQLKRAKVPSDYGASWSTLFLSPVVGALTGWFGVLMITVATDKGFLGEQLRFASFDEPCAVGTLFAAFLMGFSERLFDGIVKRFEDQIDQKEAAATKPGDAPSGPAAAPPGPSLNITSGGAHRASIY
jgi:hypothetical protein